MRLLTNTVPGTIVTAMILALFASAAPAMDEDHKPMTTATGIPSVTGGIGDAQRTKLKSHYGDYSFKLVNVGDSARGSYVSSVEVWIMNAEGDKVLHTTDDGPWLIADLPAGSYTLKGTFDGQTQRH